ncbi:MAG: rhodanese-like domain-containing protein [Bryobacteraceae bacterium]
MRTLLATLILAGLACVASAEVKKMGADELKETLAKNKDIYFLDVREPKELEEHGSVKGYVNIPLGQLESRLSEIPKGKTIITACERAGRATKAAVILEKNGFQVLAACGLVEWREKKYPVVHPKPAK